MRDTGRSHAAVRLRRAAAGGLRGGLYTRIKEPLFFGYVRDELVRAYGEKMVARRPARLHDDRPEAPALRRERDPRRAAERDDPAAAVVAIDPDDGAIKAMTGVIPGRAKNQFNLAAQARRQAGSTFKTFVLASAIEGGIDLGTWATSRRPSRTTTRTRSSRGRSRRTTARRTDGRPSPKRRRAPDNTVYAQLTLDIGASRVAGMARRLGVRDFAALSDLRVDRPRRGVRLAARDVVRVRDAAAVRRVLALVRSSGRPWAVRRDTESGGAKGSGRSSEGWPGRLRASWRTTSRADRVGAYFGRPAAGKTGTTDNHADAWFCGYTPHLQAAVWVGTRRAGADASVHGSPSPAGRSPPRSGRFMSSAEAAVPARLPPHPRGTRPTSPSTRVTTSTATSRTTTATDDGRTGGRVCRAPPRGRAAVAGAVTVVALVAVCSVLAWPDASPVQAAQAGGASEGETAYAWGFLAAAAAALAAYAMRCARWAVRGSAGGPSRHSPPRSRLVPLAAPLLLSTDAWTYWAYGRIAAVDGGNPYRDSPSDFPDDPGHALGGRGLARRTTVYGPAFTLASEPVAACGRRSRRRGGVALQGPGGGDAAGGGPPRRSAVLAGRRSRSPSSAGTPCWRSTSPAAVTTTPGWRPSDWSPRAAAPAERRSPAPPGRWPCSVKWVPLALLALQLLGSRSAPRRRPGALGLVAAAAVVAAAATWRYGTAWLGAAAPLARNAAEETRYALPHRLEQLGVPDGLALGLALTGAVVAWSRGSRARRFAAVCGSGWRPCVLLLATPYLAPWYLAWVGAAGGGGRRPHRPADRAGALCVPAAADDPGLTQRFRSTSTPSSSKTTRQRGVALQAAGGRRWRGRSARSR